MGQWADDPGRRVSTLKKKQMTGSFKLAASTGHFGDRTVSNNNKIQVISI